MLSISPFLINTFFPKYDLQAIDDAESDMHSVEEETDVIWYLCELRIFRLLIESQSKMTF